MYNDDVLKSQVNQLFDRIQSQSYEQGMCVRVYVNFSSTIIITTGGFPDWQKAWVINEVFYGTEMIIHTINFASSCRPARASDYPFEFIRIPFNKLIDG